MPAAVLGLTAAAILLVTVCFCARRIRRQNKKLNQDQTLPFQPSRPTRAIRSPCSPNGVAPQTHYLKKSPSPTTMKSPPGTTTIQTLNEHVSPPSAKYLEENDIIPSTILAEAPKTPDGSDYGLDQNPDGVTDDYGKLGSLVFKLRYLTDRSALVVSVVRCRGLPGRAGTSSASNDLTVAQISNGKSQNATDPYVKLQLLPDKQHKVKTRFVKIRLYW